MLITNRFILLFSESCFPHATGLIFSDGKEVEELILARGANKTFEKPSGGWNVPDRTYRVVEDLPSQSMSSKKLRLYVEVFFLLFKIFVAPSTSKAAADEGTRELLRQLAKKKNSRSHSQSSRGSSGPSVSDKYIILIFIYVRPYLHLIS